MSLLRWHSPGHSGDGEPSLRPTTFSTGFEGSRPGASHVRIEGSSHKVLIAAPFVYSGKRAKGTAGEKRPTYAERVTGGSGRHPAPGAAPCAGPAAAGDARSPP